MFSIYETVYKQILIAIITNKKIEKKTVDRFFIAY